MPEFLPTVPARVAAQGCLAGVTPCFSWGSQVASVKGSRSRKGALGRRSPNRRERCDDRRSFAAGDSALARFPQSLGGGVWQTLNSPGSPLQI
jgi:hypothetical protein